MKTIVKEEPVREIDRKIFTNVSEDKKKEILSFKTGGKPELWKERKARTWM